MGNIHVKLYGIWTSTQMQMSFKDISYLELWQPLYSVDRNHLRNFFSRHHKEPSCEIILYLDQWFREKFWKIKVANKGPFVSTDRQMADKGRSQ